MEFHSHPATRQDEWVIDRHRGKPGKYLEIGAFDGETHSNTKALEERGWRGMLVEPNPVSLEALMNNRLAENNTFVGKAIVDYEKGDGRLFYCGGQYSGFVDRMPDAWKQGHKDRGNPMIQMWDVEHINTLYHKRWKPQFGPWVHYLSLDTEGGELEILKSADWLNHVGLLTVEFRYERQLLDELCELLEPWHRLDEVRGFDACFVRR